MISSDSQAMGRIGEVVSRTWRTASKMKEYRGPLKEETGDNDNERVKVRCPFPHRRLELTCRFLLAAIHCQVHHQPVRLLSKLSTLLLTLLNRSAITHGFSHVVGDVGVGKLADLVLWSPENFGVRPESVIKGGVIAWANVSPR